MENNEWRRVVKKLGGNGDRAAAPKICDRCNATLITYESKCRAAFRDPACPGYISIDQASKP